MRIDRALGFAGSVLIAVGGLGAGALPVGMPANHPRLGLVAVYSGLMLLLLGWWRYDGRDFWGTLALWSAPLLLAPPMFSRDVYSYLAQGHMINAGLDVYRHGPAALGGLVAEQVPAVWQHTPSPYGPVFLMVAEGITDLLDDHVLLGVLAMRLVAVASLVLLAVSVRVLAREAGINPATATWLAVLNPLTIVHLVGGAHNDALMVGLLAAGLAAAVRRHPIVATVLVVAAALVKAPAALGLVAVVAICAGRRRAALIATTAAGATVLFTVVAGTGYGWIHALNTPISAHNWSLTSALGRATAALLESDGVGAGLAHGVWRWAGVLATLIVAALVWVHRARLGPVYGLGIVLTAVVAFGPALRPWYLIWALVPLAAAARHPAVRRTLAAACAVLLLVVLPDGFAPDAERVLLAVIGATIGIAVFLAVRVALAPAALRLARSVR